MHRKATGNHKLTKKSSGRRRRVEGDAALGPEAKVTRRLLGG